MNYTPDARLRLQRAQRFFARVLAFDLECPHCGTVYQIRPRRKNVNFDPWTGRFTCTNAECTRTYVIGVLAWPIGKGGGAATMTPEDQVPTPRQIGQLRKEGGGWWMPEEDAQRFKRPQETNLTTETDRPEEEED